MIFHYRVVLPYAVAGLTTRGGVVILAPPIMRWTVGKRFDSVIDFVERKGGTIEALNTMEGQL